MAIAKELFISQCKPQFGGSNPDRMYMALWEYLVRTGEDAYFARAKLALPNVLEESGACGVRNPDWCFKRFGMTKTAMPDGRIICIAGEHEDSYDPNFCIYNDVVVIRPAEGEAWVTKETGSIEIYGYPREVFRPTDFHSATLVGNEIFVIGRLGYGPTEDPEPPSTPIYSLDTTTYRMRPVVASGSSPGMIFEHHAEYEPATHSILIRGGFTWDSMREPKKQTQHGVYRLFLHDTRWEQITAHEKHRRFVFDYDGPYYEAKKSDFLPANVPHRFLLAEERGVWTYEISVSGVRVRFEDLGPVRAFVEGDLPEETLSKLLSDVATNLGRATSCEWSVKEVEKF